eukprot:286256-Hanusia_phi.AAC.3
MEEEVDSQGTIMMIFLQVNVEITSPRYWGKKVPFSSGTQRFHELKKVGGRAGGELLSARGRRGGSEGVGDRRAGSGKPGGKQRVGGMMFCTGVRERGRSGRSEYDYESIARITGAFNELNKKVGNLSIPSLPLFPPTFYLLSSSPPLPVTSLLPSSL